MKYLDWYDGSLFLVFHRDNKLHQERSSRDHCINRKPSFLIGIILFSFIIKVKIIAWKRDFGLGGYTLLDLHNSSYRTQPDRVIMKYGPVCRSLRLVLTLRRPSLFTRQVALVQKWFFFIINTSRRNTRISTASKIWFFHHPQWTYQFCFSLGKILMSP